MGSTRWLLASVFNSHARRSSLLVLLFALFGAHARGDHYAGSSITYECVGVNQYRITLDLYLDCSGAAITPQTLNFSNDCGITFSLTNIPLVLTEEVSQLCGSQLANSACNGGALPGIRHYRFQTTLVLSPCNDWTISWSICCRDATQNVQLTPGMYVAATLNNLGGLCDQSPQIGDQTIPYVCVNEPVSYNLDVTDADGNTLVYSFISAQYAAPLPTNVTYSPGFTGAAPIPGITLDPGTGQMNFTPTVTGNYVVSVQVASYNAMGQLIGTVMRDFLFVVINCSDPPADNLGPTGINNGIITSNNDIEVCTGVPFCVDISFSDIDPLAVISLASQVTADLPGSTFSVSGTNPAVATICWTPNPALSPASVLIDVNDNACPLENLSSYLLTITVVTPPPLPPDPGTNASISACPGSANVNLFSQLGGSPDVGGVWTGPNGASHSGSFNPSADLYGVYTYTVGNGCLSASATVTISQGSAANAGANASLSTCSNSAPTNIFTLLGVNAQAGGSWSGPSPVAGGLYNPATMAPGAYVYTVPGTPPCGNATATVTVTESTAPNAGTNGTLTLCTNSAATSLIAQLGGSPTAGGTWTGPSPVGGAGNYNPATMNPGVYTYTLTAVSPCANATATVTVTENAPPTAGTNGTLTTCSNAVPVALSASLGGAPQAGGTWSGPSPVVGGMYDPATMVGGAYVYTVAGTAPCANATATVTVTENAAPSAGTNGTLSICSNGALTSLIAQLGGTPTAGGTWSGPSPVGGMGNYNPATMNPGVYTYTVTGVAPCTNSTATVTVTENAAPSAGTNGPLAICSNSAAVALSSSLGGTPDAGGTWSGPSPVVGGMYDPATMVGGAYVYTVTGTAPCTNATATVTVTESAAPNAGTNGTLTICSNGAPTSLIAQLGGTPAAGGTWSGPSPVGVLGNYNPATMNPGVYTYTVTGVAPCTNSTATVTVTENTAPSAGTSGPLAICSNSAAVALSGSLGGTPDAGGTWSGPSPVVGGMYDPSTMVGGAYVYTVTGTPPCANATATVTVTENVAPSAGTNGTLTMCSSGVATSLFAQLGGTPSAGGTWSGPSPVVGVNYDPATMTPGVYTYTVTGVAPCANATATVTVTENVAPNAGTNGTLTVCSSGVATSLFAQLGGTPAAGGTWSGPSPVAGNNYDPGTMAPGVYTYTVTGVAPCVSAIATVTVTENVAPNAGTNGTLTICDNGVATSLFAQLGGTPAVGGTWSGPSPVVGGNYDPATMAPGVYTYTATGVAPCVNATATVTVTENVAPNAGTNGALTVCENGVATSLFAQLGGTPTAGGTWNGPSPVVGNNYDPATMVAGVYTYTVTGAAPCVNATATVTVTENVAPNAGTNGTLTICDNGAATSLFAQLGGTPAAGGTWSGPSPVVGGNYDPATMAPGVYTYTATGVAPCVNATATVTVTENVAPNAGTNGALTVCENGVATSLFAQLGGTPTAGGTWNGPSPVVGNNYDPATMVAGVYTYTVTGAAPCVNATATVTVTENVAPNAGANGTLTICDNGVATSLFAQLGGTPAAGGTWSGPSPVIGGNYDPATMTAGVYTYTVTGVAPCGNATATVTVTENVAPNAGTNGTLTVCSSGVATSLFAQLGGTPAAGGTWSGPSPVAGNNYDPATMGAGVYTYTVTGTAPCANATATVTVTENTAPNAGTSGPLVICSNSATVALFGSLGGTPSAGGTWSGPSPVVGGLYDPATMAGGAYVYTVNGVAPCANATATVTVTENAAPSAGTNGMLTLCSNGVATSLVAQLGGTPAAGGTWSGPSPVAGGNYDPATMAGGVYTYTVIGVAPCANAAATVTVTENAAPNPGTNGSITVCDVGGAVNLFAQLGGTPSAGGTWSGPSPVAGGNYDPATMTAGVYTYTVTGTAPCANASATVTVTETSSPDAGSNAAVTVCGDGVATNLFAQLGGTPDVGGTWSGPSPVAGNTYDPATMTAGVYTYTLNATAPCVSSSATVTVTENTPTNAGTNGSITVCDVGGAVSLFAQLGGIPAAGGTWSGPSAVVGNNYDPATMTAGVYTYTVTGTAPCANASATVTVTETSSPDAGSNGAVTVCGDGAATNLFAQLGGTPDAGGTWSGPSPVAGNTYDPATMTPGVYTYTLNATAPCVSSSATVTVTENTPTNAGTNGSITVCDVGGAANLFAQLGGTPAAGGTWSGPSAVVGNNYDPATMTAGVYTYTVTGTAPCANATATVTVTETSSPDAGSNAAVTVCGDGVATNLFAQLGGTPDAGGTWSGPSPVAGNTYDPATMNPGVYTYTLNATAPCVSSSATVTVTENTPTNAGTNGSITVCDVGGAVNLFAQLGGTPSAGGTWSGPSPVVGNNYDPATMTAGVYTYTVTGTAPCANASATVTVTETSSPDAGSNGAVTVCGDGATTNLFAQLGGTPDAGGTWSGPSPVAGNTYDPATMNPGVYTYTLNAAAPCVSASATVTVTENTPTNAGTNGSVTVCDVGGAVNLFAQLGGTPAAGGTWSGPSPVVAGNYDPATMTAGVYTYTVTGTAPCANASATVTVTETSSPDAGSNGAVTICGDGAATNLFTQLGGTPDAGGTWSGPSPVAGNTYDPATMTPGVYTYTLNATAPCVSSSSTVTVTENAPTNAGTNGSITVCDVGGAVSLFAQLGGTPAAGGTWSGPSPVAGNNYDPATMTAGVYTYTVTGTAPCANASATVTVTESSSPDAGSDATLDLCSAGVAVDLFGQLGGTPDAGGAWSGPNVLVGGVFDPAIMQAGVYTYSINGTAACPAASASVTITIEEPSDAGADGAIQLCPGSSPVDLFTVLGGTPQSGGTWTDPSGGSFSGVFDPGTDASGDHTYTIIGIACPSSSAVVAVSVLPGPDAGGDNAISLCDSQGSIALLPQLQGTPDAGGVWTNSLGVVVPPDLDPATGTSGTFTYTVTGSGNCPDDEAVLTITVNNAPSAGTSGGLVLCASSTPVSLFDGLSGTLDAGGTWTGPDATQHNTILDPASDGSGIYTYTVGGIAPCVNAVSTVNVVVNPIPYAGEDGGLVLCTSAASVELISALGGTPQPGGSWTGPNGTPTGGTFAPSTGAEGVYAYTIAGIAPCVNDTGIVTVALSQAANAGTSASVTLCAGDAGFDLFTQLGGAPDVGGTWVDPDGDVVTSDFDPEVQSSGVYTYTVTAPAPCPAQSAAVDVVVVEPVVASFLATSTGTCAPAEVSFSHAYAGPGTCTWILGNGTIVEDCAPFTATYDQPGSYDVTLIVDANNGCGADTVTLEDVVTVYAQPFAQFEMLPAEINTLDPNAYFNNTTQGANSYAWFVNDVLITDEEDLQYLFAGEIGDDYGICLVAIAAEACADTACQYITVEDGLRVFVPNTFTPDGNEHNNVFKPIVSGIDPRFYLFEIYDRWGMRILSTTDPTAYWDGTVGGAEAPQDVYVWKLIAKDAYSGDRVERIGHVTLLR